MRIKNHNSFLGHSRVFRAALLGIAVFAIALLPSGWEPGERPSLARTPSTDAPAATPSVVVAIGAVDAPIDELINGTTLRTAGWALHPAGIAGVEIRFDGRPHAARYGVTRDDVGKVKPGYPDSSASGFEFEGDFGSVTPARHVLEIVAYSRTGSETVLSRKSLVPPEAMNLWSDLLITHRELAKQPFRFLMMTSGVASGGATEVDTAYRGYLSRTQQTGVAVPILYLRTTKGARSDWVFDPDFDLHAKCGDRAVADDSLNGVIRYAIANQLPVQFILNGGIWADATCDTPEWDVNDHLEQDIDNCQWTQDNIVFPDDYLKNLPGSTNSPQLGRSLTYNVYASTIRAYKRRNLQAAARVIAAFAREHPNLFVGVNVDADTYMNPFPSHGNWFDYNPGMLKQFRHWLAGSGPYAGKSEQHVPDLSAYRRKDPLSLADVNRLARKNWRSWDLVDPPRRFPGSDGKTPTAGEVIYWNDPWYQEWDAFRKHVVALHYSELSQWVFEAGIPRDRIFSSQAFIAPDAGFRSVSLRIRGSSPNYDSAGVSIEGSIPAYGHAGAILYGPAAANQHPMEDGRSLFSTLARMDPGWAIVETNATDLKAPLVRPTFAQSYHAFRDLFNFDGSQVSVMAWNGWNGIFADQPGYLPYTSWRNTPAENAMRAFLVSHADLPLGARLWTFGDPSYGDDDGWRAEGGRLSAPGGFLDIELDTGGLALTSPPDQVIRVAKIDSLILGLRDPGALESVRVFARVEPDAPWQAITQSVAAKSLAKVNAGLRLPLQWPAAWRTDGAIATQLKLELRLREGTRRVPVDRVALYPAHAL